MNRAVFLDRDGVINAAIWNPVEGKLDTPYRLEDFRLLPGVGQAVRAINEMGFLAVVVSNQPGVAKGKCGPELLEELNRHMLTALAAMGARLDGIYYCLHHPEAVVPALRVDCACRKPRPGLLVQAAKELDIDPARSYMVGDQRADVEAGLAVGCKTVLLNGHPVPEGRAEGPRVQAHQIARDLSAAVRAIRRAEGGGRWKSS
jgi:D-glycero-D-manno-heptose 1,7-bisphosphate phosphatase